MTRKLLAVAALFSLACSGADLTAPSEMAELSAGAPQATRGTPKMVPINGTVYGWSFPLGNGTAVGCPVSYNRTGLELAGEISHLGHSTLSSVHCNRTLSANPLTIDALGSGAMTAANGDQLAFTYTLTSATIVSTTPPTVDFSIAVTFDGGTGRFGGAIGQAELACRRTPIDPANPPPAHVPPFVNVYDCSLAGLISSVGSSK